MNTSLKIFVVLFVAALVIGAVDTVMVLSGSTNSASSTTVAFVAADGGGTGGGPGGLCPDGKPGC